MKIFLSLLIWSISFICNAADNTYLCITEAAGGVRFDSKQNKFVGSAFDIQNPKKILVKKENDGKWTIKDFGSDIDSVWGKCTERKIKNSLNNYAVSKGIKIKDFGPILRIVLTFSSASSGGIFDVIDILGKEWTLKRLDRASKLLINLN